MHFNIIPHFFGLSIVFLKKMKKIPKNIFRRIYIISGRTQKRSPKKGSVFITFRATYAPKIRATSGAIRAGKKIAGKRFAVLTLVAPRRFVPINIMISEPVIDI